jgi:4-hydroxy-3-polyprenylbenzoate decarboxylase
VNESTEYKHWGCDVLIIDARSKPHHAPVLEKNDDVEKRVNEILSKINL